jgi:diguanylate cyclase (GGDEF)-like protein
VLANSTLLLASPDPAVLSALEPTLAASCAQVKVALSAEAALAALIAPHPPGLALLDVNLPGMEIGQLLAAARPESGTPRFPIVLISDTVTLSWIDRMAEGVIDDLLPRTIDPAFLRPRLEAVLRSHETAAELELLRDSTALNTQLDRLTGIYNRETMLGVLFRETDRVQRMKGSLCLILFDIDDFGHWNSRLGGRVCDELLCQVVARTTRLLRSYDLLGRVGKDEFLVGLPGCGIANTMMLAERLRLEVFSAPFRLGGESIRLSACFGIASSQGRSPVVVLREAEQALQWAKAEGPESIQRFGESQQKAPAPVTFISQSSGDDLLAW